MAKATHSTTFPVSGDAFSIANFNNAFNALHQGDIYPLRPRAHATPDMGIMIGGTLVESYYSQVYSSGDFPSALSSGDVNFTAPVSNPRIDLVYLSGDTLRVQGGSEAASPAIPSFPTNSIVTPVALVYHRTTEVKIVNYEDTGANPNEGYIYRDVRPLIGRGGASTYSDSLTSGDLSGTVWNITHNLGKARPNVVLWSGDDLIFPDDITTLTNNSLSIDVTSFQSGMSGTWYVEIG